MNTWIEGIKKGVREYRVVRYNEYGVKEIMFQGTLPKCKEYNEGMSKLNETFKVFMNVYFCWRHLSQKG